MSEEKKTSLFRDLRADEIDVRVARVKKDGVVLLLYKDARVDQNILDETFTPFGWQREHKELKGNIYCGISIYDDERKQWVTKWDCGKESFSEAEKGEASDSFKRAGFNWGIGRELYTAPFIFLSNKVCVIKESGRKDKFGNAVYETEDTFRVEAIRIENHIITGLSLKNQANVRVFLYDPDNKEKPKETK
jgi:hypothetical protein